MAETADVAVAVAVYAAVVAVTAATTAAAAVAAADYDVVVVALVAEAGPGLPKGMP